MNWKNRYVWYSLVFAIIFSLVLIPFVDWPYNLVGYIAWVIVISYDVYLNVRSKDI